MEYLHFAILNVEVSFIDRPKKRLLFISAYFVYLNILIYFAFAIIDNCKNFLRRMYTLIDKLFANIIIDHKSRKYNWQSDDINAIGFMYVVLFMANMF